MSELKTNTSLTPAQIVNELDRHIVGQNEAKRAVAIALRNRFRRMQLNPELRAEVTPKNILMIGPTGVGKTEIARRLARLVNAPFLKVEATKVGYVGRDVESIIRDLADSAVKMLREQAWQQVQDHAEAIAEEKILDILVAPPRDNEAESQEDSRARQMFRKRLREGNLDDTEIEIEMNERGEHFEVLTPPGMEELAEQMESMFSKIGGNKRKLRKIKIGQALKQLTEEEASNLIDIDKIKQEARDAVEQNGIVFIDEIDKVAKSSKAYGADVSREGVQRDLLPLIEGSTVKTKIGMLKTDHILFIASGAFHLTKPSDLVPELQGRLPIRVELKALTPVEFKRILIEPDASLTLQYQELLNTEGLKVSFTEDGIESLAQIAYKVNESTENIGARRLHTLLERLFEEVSFNAPDNLQSNSVLVNKEYVEQKLADLAGNEDLSRYIL